MKFKVDLPNYGVFDEKRVFTPGPMPGPIAFRGVRIGVPICEDIWGPEPVECLSETGGEILLVPNGPPYWRGKVDERLTVYPARVRESHLPLIYLNQLPGGQDDLVFDGASFALNADGSQAFQLPAFEEMVAKTVWERHGNSWACLEEGPQVPREDGDAADYRACVLGLRQTMSARMDFRESCLASRAVSIQRFARQLPSMRLAPNAFTPDAALSFHLGRVACRCQGLRRGSQGAFTIFADRPASKA